MNAAPEAGPIVQSAVVPPTDWLAEYPPPRSLPLDQEALRIFEHAYAIGMKVESDGPAITFSTLIAALLEGQDVTSRWFGELAQEYGPQPSAVFAEKGVNHDTVVGLFPPPGKPDRVRLSDNKHVLTLSARNVLLTAENWAQRVGGTDIGVRHLVASLVLSPPLAHRQQMQRWNYQEVKWRSEFFDWIARRYTAEQWTDAVQRPAPAAAVPAFEQQQLKEQVKGKDIAYPGDEQTLAVLEQAARFHAQRPDHWLRMQTVFHALVKRAQDDAAVRTAIEPLITALDAVQPRYQQVLADFKAETVEKPYAIFDALDLSPRVLNALETARGLAVATGKDAKVCVHHLAGALLSRRVDAEEALTPMGLNVQELRRAMIAAAQKHDESTEAWSESLGEEDVQAGRPLELNSDDPDAAMRGDERWLNDPLSIRRDVKTFAALLTSKSLEPPLSIGLFGPWGSGKTTFLRRLRKEVQSLADTARAAGNDKSPYVGNVVHVDFNAWHFAESALTSSLVDKILRELEMFITGNQLKTPKEWQELTLKKLETADRNARAAEEFERSAKVAVTKAEGVLTVANENASAATVSFQGAMMRVWQAFQKSVKESKVVENSGVVDALGSTIRSADDLRERVTALRNRPARLLGDLGWVKSLILAILVLGVPPLIAWFTNTVLQTNQAASALSTVTAALSMIGVWIRAASGAVAKVDKAVADVAAQYEEALANDAGVKKAQVDLDAAQASAVTAATALDAARQELARAQTEVANAALPAQMLQLVSNRLEAQTYAKELTSISLARADLEGLSRILHAQRGPNGGAPTSPLRSVDRVILYIDDLDRCKPQDVVRVLQLVHMLLAFELFVVVVAVDARWVEESLKDSYDWLADGPIPVAGAAANGGVRANMEHLSPQDYLEKIFQIVFWLEPMTVSRAADYLGSLVRAPARESGAVYGFAPDDASTGAPAKVEIKAIELDYMRYLAAHVGSSPRRVKRFVNAYRLIKAGMSDNELRTFLTEEGGISSGPYQVVIGLLVIGTGAPASSAQILTELAECHPGATMVSVVDSLRERNQPDWTMAAQVIEALMQSQKAQDVRDLRGWARRVRRFLLNGGRYSYVGLVKEEEPVLAAAPVNAGP